MWSLPCSLRRSCCICGSKNKVSLLICCSPPRLPLLSLIWPFSACWAGLWRSREKKRNWDITGPAPRSNQVWKYSRCWLGNWRIRNTDVTANATSFYIEKKCNVFLLLSLDLLPSGQWTILNVPVLVSYIKGSKQSQIIPKGFPQQQISSHEESKAVSEVNRMSRRWLYFSNAVFQSHPFSLGPLQKPFWYCRELIFAIIWEERRGDVRIS